MTQQDTLPRKKTEKFFFDRNNFDDDYVEIIEEEEPPPPVFSENEHESAQKEAFERGRKQGLEEEKQSRQKYITDILKAISDSFPTLLAQEHDRRALYEQEAVSLTHTIFKKLFPVLNEENGLNEVKSIITKVLDQHKEQPEIIINIKAGYGDDIRALIDETLQKNPENKGKITIHEQENLETSDCTLSWKNGGAERNTDGLIQEIEKHLKETLADKPFLPDNGSSDDNINTDTITDTISDETGLSYPLETETKNE